MCLHPVAMSSHLLVAFRRPSKSQTNLGNLKWRGSKEKGNSCTSWASRRATNAKLSESQCKWESDFLLILRNQTRISRLWFQKNVRKQRLISFNPADGGPLGSHLDEKSPRKALGWETVETYNLNNIEDDDLTKRLQDHAHETIHVYKHGLVNDHARLQDHTMHVYKTMLASIAREGQ